MTHDNLGDRMKRYEEVPKHFLTRRMPVIARIDGRAFHTFTKKITEAIDPTLATQPFSSVMHNVMSSTTAMLVHETQGCIFGYTQSDEISLLLRDWDTIHTQAWFDYNIQKMTSLFGAMASNAFNYSFSKFYSPKCFQDLAQFDARVFNIPKEEVANYFIWRQQDASRNSIQLLGHFHFSQNKMHGRSNDEIQDMLMLDKGVNWNDLPTWAKRGSCVITQHRDCINTPNIRINCVDDEIPIFTQDRNYINQYLTNTEDQHG